MNPNTSNLTHIQVPVGHLTPELLAAAWWNLDADQHVQFFAALHDIAGVVPLCAQSAHIVVAFGETDDVTRGKALSAFRTMFHHTESVAETLTDWASMHAQIEISDMAVRAKERAP